MRAQVDIDAHAYNIVARAGLYSVRGYISAMTLDVAFVLQGSAPEQLPEQVMACARLQNFDFMRVRSGGMPVSLTGLLPPLLQQQQSSSLRGGNDGSAWGGGRFSSSPR